MFVGFHFNILNMLYTFIGNRKHNSHCSGLSFACSGKLASSCFRKVQCVFTPLYNSFTGTYTV